MKILDEEYYECESGWRFLIDEAQQVLDDWNKEHPDQIPLEFVQVKEKFGKLVIYISDWVPEVIDKLKVIQAKSSEYCERCGSNENVKTLAIGSQIRTFCDECRTKISKK